jgi:hypothetical protein
MRSQITLLLVLFAMAITVQAQSPNAIPYQGVARNLAGNILASQNIGLRISIHDVTPGGTEVFSETHAVTTTNLGLFNVKSLLQKGHFLNNLSKKIIYKHLIFSILKK